MQKVTAPTKIYLYWYISPYANRGTFSVSEHKFSKDNGEFTMLKELDVDFGVVDFDPLMVEIEGLEAALQKMRADNHVKEQALVEKIANLKCIGHDDSTGRGAGDTHEDFPVFDDDIHF